jgi:hypothetical protein
LRRVGWVADLDVVVEYDAVVVVDDLCGVAELDRLPSRPLAIGRASGSCSDTRRVAPCGVVPARRWRVWQAMRSTRSAVFSSVAIAARTRPDTPASLRG